jgi:hypothetical protein
MAKNSNRGSSGMGSAPVSGRLAMDYGKQLKLNRVESSEPKHSNMVRARETSKEFSKGSPHPRAKQEEGPIGRKSYGSEVLGTEKTHFNHHRAAAASLSGYCAEDSNAERKSD